MGFFFLFFKKTTCSFIRNSRAGWKHRLNCGCDNRNSSTCDLYIRLWVPTNPTLPNVEIAPLEPLNASLESSNIFHLTFLASGFYNIIMCTTICPVLLPFTNQYAFIRKAKKKLCWCLPFLDLSHKFLQNQIHITLFKETKSGSFLNQVLPVP